MAVAVWVAACVDVAEWGPAGFEAPPRFLERVGRWVRARWAFTRWWAGDLPGAAALACWTLRVAAGRSVSVCSAAPATGARRCAGCPASAVTATAAMSATVPRAPRSAYRRVVGPWCFSSCSPIGCRGRSTLGEVDERSVLRVAAIKERAGGSPLGVLAHGAQVGCGRRVRVELVVPQARREGRRRRCCSPAAPVAGRECEIAPLRRLAVVSFATHRAGDGIDAARDVGVAVLDAELGGAWPPYTCVLEVVDDHREPKSCPTPVEKCRARGATHAVWRTLQQHVGWRDGAAPAVT